MLKAEKVHKWQKFGDPPSYRYSRGGDEYIGRFWGPAGFFGMGACNWIINDVELWKTNVETP